MHAQKSDQDTLPVITIEEAQNRAIASFPQIRIRQLRINSEEALKSTAWDLGRTEFFTGQEEFGQGSPGIYNQFGIRQKQIDVFGIKPKLQWHKERITLAEDQLNLSKAIHIHADIKQKNDNLIPGMYINGKIHATSETVAALPEGAIIEEDGIPYIFTAEQQIENGETEWYIKMIEVRTGKAEGGWIEVKLLEPLPQGTKVTWNNAYYLISEMKKSETSHSH